DLFGTNTSTHYAAASFSFDSTGTVLTIDYVSLPPDAYTLTLAADGVADLVGLHQFADFVVTFSVAAPPCGDGIIGSGEQCDDANTTSGDGCSATCTTEPGYTCTGAPSVCTPVCGDGLMVGNETCDDGNTTDDGNCCSATCQIESDGTACADDSNTCT